MCDYESRCIVNDVDYENDHDTNARETPIDHSGYTFPPERNVKHVLEMLAPFNEGKRIRLVITRYFTGARLFDGGPSNYDGQFDDEEVRIIWVDDDGTISLSIGSFRSDGI